MDEQRSNAIALVLLLAVPAACSETTFAAAGDAGKTDDGGATHDGKATLEGAASTDAGADTTDGTTAEPRTPKTLVKGQTALRAIVVDGTHLIWVSAEDATGTAGTGSVWQALTNGTTVTALAKNQTAPLDIARDDTNVYWSVGTGSPPTAAQTQCLVMTEVKASGAVSCVSRGAFMTMRMSLDTKNVIVLAQAAGAANPTVGYTSKTEVLQTYTNVAAQGPASAVAASDATIYVGDARGTHIDACTIDPLGFGNALCGNGACGTGTVVDLVLDTSEDNAFWATTTGDVLLESYAQPGTPQTLATVTGTPQRITRDPTYVYVTTSTTGGLGDVVAIPITGGAAKTIATGEAGPFGIATDGVNVYWTCSDGTIRAVGVPM